MCHPTVLGVLAVNSHSSHLYVWPSCIACLWIVRLPRQLALYLQKRHWNFIPWCFLFWWCVSISFKISLSKSHWLHVYFTPLWLACLCFSASIPFLDLVPHFSQWTISSEWKALWCLFKDLCVRKICLHSLQGIPPWYVPRIYGVLDNAVLKTFCYKSHTQVLDCSHVQVLYGSSESPLFYTWNDKQNTQTRTFRDQSKCDF